MLPLRGRVGLVCFMITSEMSVHYIDSGKRVIAFFTTSVTYKFSFSNHLETTVFQAYESYLFHVSYPLL